MKKDKTNKVKKIIASLKQRAAARKNIKKAQAKWKSMTHRQHALAQPQGRARKKPGMGGSGKFYRVVVRPKSEFTSFRVQDVGKKGHVERVAGRRSSGSWATQAWLIDKKEAHVASNGYLIGDSQDVKDVFSKLRTKPRHLKGDIFEAGPRVNVPERLKPTPAMKRAQRENIKKAQAKRWARK